MADLEKQSGKTSHVQGHKEVVPRVRGGRLRECVIIFGVACEAPGESVNDELRGSCVPPRCGRLTRWLWASGFYSWTQRQYRRLRPVVRYLKLAGNAL